MKNVRHHNKTTNKAIETPAIKIIALLRNSLKGIIMKKTLAILVCISSLASSILLAGEAIIEKVVADCNKKRVCKFDVTVKHQDEGWNHFANGWQIFTPKGELLGHRALAHPHVNEQPFTRSIRNIKIPPAVDSVVFIANDSVHGTSDRRYVIKLKFTDY